MRVLVIFIPKSFPNKCLHFKKLGLWIIFQSSFKEKSQHENNLNNSTPIISNTNNGNNENVRLYSSELTSPIKSTTTTTTSSTNQSFVSSASAYSSFNSMTSMSSTSSINSSLSNASTISLPSMNNINKGDSPPPQSSSTNGTLKKKRSWRIRTPSPKPKAENAFNQHNHHHHHHGHHGHHGHFYNNNFSDLSVQLPPTPTYPEKPMFLSNSNHIPKPRSRHSHTNSLDNNNHNNNYYSNYVNNFNNNNNVNNMNMIFNNNNNNNNNNNYNLQQSISYTKSLSTTSIGSNNSINSNIVNRKTTPSPTNIIYNNNNKILSNSSQTTISNISSSSSNSSNISLLDTNIITSSTSTKIFTKEIPICTEILKPIPIKSSSLSNSQIISNSQQISSSTSLQCCNTAIIEDIPLVPVLSSSSSSLSNYPQTQKAILTNSTGVEINIQSPLPHQISINSKDDNLSGNEEHDVHQDDQQSKLSDWINNTGTQMCRDQITINPFEKSTKEIY